MPTPFPRSKRLADLKASILRPATTSNFQCWFNPPLKVRDWLSQRQSAGLLPKHYIGNEEFYSLSCSEASLPGSTFATHQITNDHSGVTERHVYRRQYDDKAEFSFYVDHGYNPILLFEHWMAYIANEQRTASPAFSSVNDENRYSYRMNFPQGDDGYTSQIYINKFEKDYAGRMLQYRFLKAFPISINTMALSYNSSELLKCTVSFSYTRYVVDNIQLPNDDTWNDDYNRPQAEVDYMNNGGFIGWTSDQNVDQSTYLNQGQGFDDID